MEDEYALDLDANTEKGRISFISEIDKIKNSSQSAETKLSLLDILVKDFMRKRFHIKKASEYSELIDFFLQKSKTHMAVFCHEMVRQMYSGDGMNQDSVSLLCDAAKKMIEKEFFGVVEKKKEDKKGLFFIGKSNKNKKSESKSDRIMGREAERAIEKALQIEQSIKIDKFEEDGGSLSRGGLMSEVSILPDVSLNNSNTETELSEDEDRRIRSIDDLDRIKRKIQHKKLMIAEEKAGRAEREMLEKTV